MISGIGIFLLMLIALILISNRQYERGYQQARHDAKFDQGKFWGTEHYVSIPFSEWDEPISPIKALKLRGMKINDNQDGR